VRGLPYVRRPRRSRQFGGTAVEFALVFPIFFTLIAGALEGGRFVVSRMMLSYAVSVGARAASLKSASTTSVQNAVVNAAPMLHLSASQVEISPTLPITVGTAVTVSVGVSNPANKYQFKSIIPSKFSPFSTRSWSAQATMTVR
jgi:Flp pilus assembly protein TadG